MTDRPRPDDHLVEPLYSAIDSRADVGSDEPRGPSCGTRCALLVLLILVLTVVVLLVAITPR